MKAAAASQGTAGCRWGKIVMRTILLDRLAGRSLSARPSCIARMCTPAILRSRGPLRGATVLPMSHCMIEALMRHAARRVRVAEEGRATTRAAEFVPTA
jgi:hypothetical protein